MASAEASAADVLAEIRALRKGAGGMCTAGPFIASLSDADRAAIRVALEDGTADYSTIGRFCKTRGYQYTEQAVARHLAGRCACLPR